MYAPPIVKYKSLTILASPGIQTAPRNSLTCFFVIGVEICIMATRQAWDNSLFSLLEVHISSRSFCATWEVWGQPGLHETLSVNKQNPQTKPNRAKPLCFSLFFIFSINVCVSELLGRTAGAWVFDVLTQCLHVERLLLCGRKQLGQVKRDNKGSRTL